MRDERREKDRYPRASIAEQLGGELRSLSRHPGIIVLLIALVGGGLFLVVSQPQVVRIGSLRTGDCLYIRAADADPQAASGRTIGSEGALIESLYAQGAERASCDLSHSHEVADAWILDDALGSAYPGLGALTAAHRDRCVKAFEAYVGHPLDGSIHALVIAVPTPAAWERGALAAACLVERRDGTYLMAHARDSAQ